MASVNALASEIKTRTRRLSGGLKLPDPLLWQPTIDGHKGVSTLKLVRPGSRLKLNADAGYELNFLSAEDEVGMIAGERYIYLGSGALVGVLRTNFNPDELPSNRDRVGARLEEQLSSRSVLHVVPQDYERVVAMLQQAPGM